MEFTYDNVLERGKKWLMVTNVVEMEMTKTDARNNGGFWPQFFAEIRQWGTITSLS